MQDRGGILRRYLYRPGQPREMSENNGFKEFDGFSEAAAE
jgi:hypothetical protein